MAEKSASRRDVAKLLLASLLGGHFAQSHPGRALAQERRAGDPPQGQVDALVQEHMQQHRVPGLSLAVMRDGAAIRTAAYGIADLATGAKCEPNTVYNIGSISKQFIATAIMMLAQDRKLVIDDPVSQFLGDAPEAWREITLRHLLSHTAGLVRNPPAYERSAQTTPSEHIRKSYATALLSKPGDSYSYSNLGYFVLGEVVEKASGQSWSQFLQTRVFGPAGLDQTGPGELASLGKAVGHVVRRGQLVPSEGYAVPRPSGGIQSTVGDLVKWDKALRGDQFLSAASRKAMWTPARLNSGRLIPYGFGWRIAIAARPRMISHSGHVPGFGAILIRQTEAGLGLAMLANLDAPLAKLGILAAQVYGQFASPGDARPLRGLTLEPE